MPFAIPSEWRDVLREVQEVFPSAVIAGGALRDSMWDKPVKDVDILVPVTFDYIGSLDAAYEAVWNMFSGQDIVLDSQSQYGVKCKEDEDRDLYAIFKLTRGYKYDIILCTPDAARIETFDINICQISYDARKLLFTGDYAHGFLTRQIKVVNVNRTDRNAARVQRLLEKYPNFTVEQTNER